MKTISAVGAVSLLVVYIAWVVPYLRADTLPGAETEGKVGDSASSGGGAPHPRVELSEPNAGFDAAVELSGVRARVLGLVHARVFAGGVASAFVSDWFVNALSPAIAQLHISQRLRAL